MGRRRPPRGRQAEAADSPAREGREEGNVPGVYPIDAGQAEILEDPWTPGVWLLKVDGVESSQLNPDHPETLGFEYMRWAAAVVRHRWDTDARLRVLHLGGAGCTLARWAAAVYPESRQVAVELDAGLAALARERFALPRAPRLRIRVGEAGEVLAGIGPGSRDLIIRDVFAADPDAPAGPDGTPVHTTPAHLCGLDAARAADAALAPGGVYVANVGGGPDLSGVRTEVATLRAVFAHVEAIADPPMLKGRRRGNVILAASQAPVWDEALGGRAGLARTLLADPLPARLVEDTARFAASAAPDGTPLLNLSAPEN